MPLAAGTKLRRWQALFLSPGAHVSPACWRGGCRCSGSYAAFWFRCRSCSGRWVLVYLHVWQIFFQTVDNVFESVKLVFGYRCVWRSRGATQQLESSYAWPASAVSPPSYLTLQGFEFSATNIAEVSQWIFTVHGPGLNLPRRQIRLCVSGDDVSYYLLSCR